MPMISQAQRAAMHAAKAGRGRLGIPRKVAEEFVKEDIGGKLPKRAPRAKTRWRHRTILENKG